MKKRLTLFFYLFAAAFTVGAQEQMGPYQFPFEEVTFQDTFYQTGSIKARIYFPSEDGVNPAPFHASVVAFGHGFNLSYTDYLRLYEHLASNGYLVIAPDVQNGFSVDHTTFAKQLAACIQYLQREGITPASKYYQKVMGYSASMGHSMGGGASMLVPLYYPKLNAIVGLAAAQTSSTPTAIDALKTIQTPLLLISGQKDGVAPEADHQNPMYDNAAGKKMHISIKEAGHCKFTDGQTICDLAAVATPDKGTLTNAEQQSIAKRYVNAFFTQTIKDNFAGLPYLCGDSIKLDTRLDVYENFCVINDRNDDPKANDVRIYPNPANDRLTVAFLTPASEQSVVVLDAMGRVMSVEMTVSPFSVELNTALLPSGVYWLRGCGRVQSFVKN